MTAVIIVLSGLDVNKGMDICLYCQSALPEHLGAERFCCRSCETLWGLAKGKVLDLSYPKTDSQVYQYMDEEDFLRRYNLLTGGQRFKFFVEGIVCASCVHLIEDLPKFLKGVTSSRLDLSESTVTIDFVDSLKVSTVAQAIEDLGYKVRPVVDQKDILEQQKLENRKALKELAVAGALAGNIMLFTVPIYGGLQDEMARTFEWISFFLFLPLIFFSARPFYQNAWKSFQKRAINVDVTIVIALWLGFILSVVNLFKGRSELYFDSTASFIFLILASRFYMRKIQQKFLHRHVLSQFFYKEYYQVNSVSENETAEKRTADRIIEGDIVHLKAGQIVPCDAEIKSQAASFDLSYLTGESWPQEIQQRSMVFAGSRLVSESAELRVLNPLAQSQLGQLVQKIESISSISEVYKSETDRAAHWLTVIVLSIAGLFFLFYSVTDPWQAFQRSLALLIVACPCAIAFGTPLALSLGIKKAVQKGFFIRSESFFERLSQINTIILDKTGTLTESKLELVRTFPAELSTELKNLVVLAESSSRHPVATTLKELWSGQKADSLFLLNCTSIAGTGVEALCDIRGQQVRVKVTKSESAALQSGLMEVVVAINDQPKAYLFFQEKVRAHSSRLIDRLYKNKKNVFILTGDIKSRALDLAKKFHIPSFRVFSGQSPESKADLIAQHNPCLYVGDGFNDLLALKKAYVSYAIEGQFDVTLSVADVYAPGKGPEGLLYLLQLSQQVRSIVRGNIFFALIYNMAAGSLALLGCMNPLMAAILMPISSTVILTHTIARLK